jgi:hypothetical protein
MKPTDDYNVRVIKDLKGDDQNINTVIFPVSTATVMKKTQYQK